MLKIVFFGVVSGFTKTLALEKLGPSVCCGLPPSHTIGSRHTETRLGIIESHRPGNSEHKRQ